MALYDILKKYYAPFPNVTVTPIVTADLVKRGALNPDNIIAFFLPGGNHAKYDENIGPKGFQIMREYVHNGGYFVGICAGAYYSGTSFEWALENAPPRLKKTGLLNLFNIHSKGPASYLLRPNEKYYGDPTQYYGDPTLQNVKYTTPEGLCYKLPAIYWGGPIFVFEHEAGIRAPNIDAWLDAEKIPAIISKTYGFGRVTLSMVHPEINADAIEKYILASPSLTPDEREYFNSLRKGFLQHQADSLFINTIFRPIMAHQRQRYAASASPALIT